jgi:hypothetical protein
MSPTNPKPQSLVNEDPTEENKRPPPSSDDNPLPEMDLISLDEPVSVDLGDFTNVWRYLSSLSNPLQPVTCVDVTEMPASRKQLLKTIPDDVRKPVKANIPPKNGTRLNTPIERTKRKPKNCTQSETPAIAITKNNKNPTFACSSSEDDFEDSSCCSSSYEDKSLPFTSPRRKSLLYVAPSFSSPAPPPKPPSFDPSAPSASVRRRNLIQKLISNYPSEINKILIPGSNSPNSNTSYLSSIATLQSPDLHIFIDNSNILIGFYDIYKVKHNITDPFFRAPKFDFHAFSTIIERGRPISQKTLVGSYPLTQPVSLAQQLGYEVFILERVVDTKRGVPAGNAYSSDSATRTPQREKKKEQAVDEILHLKILECLLDVAKPGTIVLATGDAAPAEFSPEGGFLKCIKRALMRGWFVELVCWRKSMSRLWRDKGFRIEWKDTFSVVELDDYVDELVLE